MLNRRHRRIKKRVIAALLIFILILSGLGIVQFFHANPALPQINIGQKIKEEKPINLLLLGVGGGTHEGPDLADTIIFASLDPKSQQVTLASVPRDLWIPDLHAKVNTAYVFGEEKNEGSGLLLAKATVQKIINQPVDHVIRIDFDGFIKGVDMMGGLDIDVQRSFDDYAYPLGGKEADPCGLEEEKIASLSAEIASGSATELESFPCRYEHLHFDKGDVHMDGATALKYVRSRHALGPEGSDFARSKRQEKVISAFKQKLFSAGTLLNPAKVIGLLGVLKDSIKTDISPSEYGDLVSFLQKMKGAKIMSAIIDAGDGERLGLLENPPISDDYSGAWVLIPRAGASDYSEIQEYVSCVIKGGTCIVGEDGILTPTPQITKAAD
jgi:LCP family protein required for cell wall assembly